MLCLHKWKIHSIVCIVNNKKLVKLIISFVQSLSTLIDFPTYSVREIENCQLIFWWYTKSIVECPRHRQFCVFCLHQYVLSYYQQQQ